MRIVYLNPVGDLGGAELSLLDMMAALRSQDDSLDLHLISGTPGPLLDRAVQLGAHCHLAAMPEALLQLGDSALTLAGSGRLRPLLGLTWRGLRASLAVRQYVRQLSRMLEELAPTLIHSNGIKFHFLSRMIRPAHVPIIWHIRDFLGGRAFVSRALRWAARDVTVALANSQAVAGDARMVLPATPVQVLYNGIDMAKFSPGPGNGPSLDVLAGLPPAADTTLRIGLPATYARWKGQDLFLQAARRLLQSCPNLPVRFYIIGQPLYQTIGSQFSQSELRQLVDALNLGDRVGFVPFQHDMVSVYRALDIVVHASTRPEPFGRTIVEAMACGRPVVAAWAGGVMELFTPDRDALGFPPNDAAALAEALGRLTNDSGLRQRLAENARRRAILHFDRQRLGPALLSTYQDVLRSSGQGRGPG